MPNRGAALLTFGLIACASHLERTKPPSETPRTSAGTAWEGDACITLRSRDERVDVGSAMIDGDLHKGREHCYLDLQRARCVRFPADDGGTDEVYVRALRLDQSCESQPEVRFRGSIHGAVEPLGVQHPSDWTIDAHATSIERAKHVVQLEVDASAARKELLESFMLRCWRDASVASNAVDGHLALAVVVSPSGEVGEFRERESVSAPERFAACVEKSIRAPQMFLESDAGAAREVSLRVSFSVSVSPLP